MTQPAETNPKTKKREPHYPLKKRISHILEYVVWQGLRLWVNLFPFSWLHGLSRVLVVVLRPLLGSGRRRIEANLDLVMPELRGKEREDLIRYNLVHTVRVFLEVFQCWKLRNPRFLKKHIRFAAADTLAIPRERSGGMIAIQGHYGSWEVPLVSFATVGVPNHFAVKRLSNPLTDRSLMKIRQAYGGTPIYMEDSAQLVRALKKGEIIGLAADQDAGPGGIFVDFMGQPSSTFPGPALLSYMTESPLVFVSCLYRGRGVYEIDLKFIKQEVRKSDYGSREEALRQITQEWSTFLEKEVRSNPREYFWVHRRWKSKPA